MINFLYQVVLGFGLLFYLPKLLFRKKEGASLSERFGVSFNGMKKTKPMLIWIHAVSLGETKAVAPLAKMLKDHYGSEAQFVISSGTETGRAEVQKAIPFCDVSLYLPLDFSWVMKPLVTRLKPDLVLITETDLWANFLRLCKKQGAQCYLVNGELSERSTKRYEAVPFWTRHVFSAFDLICAQSTHYRDRYVKLGVPMEKLFVTGNIKLDQVHPVAPDITQWRESLGFTGSDQILTIGSTHDPEERWFLELLDGLWNELPNLKVILVPRHPERFDDVAQLLDECGQPYKRYSHASNEPFRILLVDEMGVLKKCYQISDVSLVAGSYVESVGGHNILEPSEYAKPVIFGPCMQAQPELLELCLSYEAGIQVPMQDLNKTLRQLLNDAGEKQRLGLNGRRLIEDNRGATKRTFNQMMKRTLV